MTERAHDDLDERDAKLRAIGVDPDRLVDERDVPYLLGDVFREAGLPFGPQQQEAVVCALLGYRYPDQLAKGDPAPDLTIHPLDEGAAVPIGQLHGQRPLVLFFGSYT